MYRLQWSWDHEVMYMEIRIHAMCDLIGQLQVRAL